ncbi:hypothetical protein lerEdw1_013515, partial [Lerista edwardsae]
TDACPDRGTPRKGNTVYVYGADMKQTMLHTAFSAFGNIIDLSMDSPRKFLYELVHNFCIDGDLFLSFQLNDAVVEDVRLKVSIARKQPMLDVAIGNSLWGSLGK